MININSHIRIVPRVSLVLEAVHIGEIDARDAYADLVMDAEILVDDAEIKKIRAMPEIQAALGSAAPTGPVYGGTELNKGDWRAKGSEMRKTQWKQKAVIDYIASTYKDAVIQAINKKFAPLPEQWRQALLEKPTYRMDVTFSGKSSLQLSPTADGKFKRIFVQVVLSLGDYETEDGFLGKLGKEIEQAIVNNQVQEAADGLIWKSSLSGLETLFKSLDPHSGYKDTHQMFSGGKMIDVARWGHIKDDPVGGPPAAEPGYDWHIKEGLLDQIQNTLESKLMEGVGVRVESLKVSDDGVFVFKASPPEPATEPEQIADDIEEEPTE